MPVKDTSHRRNKKWKFEGHNAKQKGEHWNSVIQQWRPWIDKKGREADDIKRHAGLSWNQNGDRWRTKGDAYFQKCKARR